MAGDGRVRFGGRLRHAREANRMSLGDLGERSGVTESFLSRVERDTTSPLPRVVVLPELAVFADADEARGLAEPVE